MAEQGTDPPTGPTNSDGSVAAPGLRKKRSKSAINPVTIPLERKEASELSLDDICLLQEQLTFWQKEAQSWRKTSNELKNRLDKALEVLSAAGIELPTASFPSAPASPPQKSSAGSWLIKIAKKREKEREKEKERLKKVLEALLKKDPSKKRTKQAADAYRQLQQFYAPVAAIYHETDSILYFIERIPNLETVVADWKQPLASLQSFKAADPAASPTIQSFKDLASAGSWSTYPVVFSSPEGPVRAGDPNADAYSIKIWKNRLITACSDGCGWGPRARTASIKANDAFCTCVEEMLPLSTDLHSTALILLRAVQEAHVSIIDGVEHPWEAGATALLAGVVLPVAKPEDNDGYPYVFMSVSVGDCKAFIRTVVDDQSRMTAGMEAGAEATQSVASTSSSPSNFQQPLPKSKCVRDLTQANRGTDPKNSGGFLGPQADKAKIFGGSEMDPLLANFSLQVSPCAQGDTLLLMSDGIHDCFDPETLGKDPATLGSDSVDWSSLPSHDSIRIRDSYRVSAIEKQLHSLQQPKDIVQGLIGYVVDLTQPTRQWMEANVGAAEPKDYKQFPGKMDHATVLAVQLP